MAPFLWDTLGRGTACAQCIYEVLLKTKQAATHKVEMEHHFTDMGYYGMKRQWLNDCMEVYKNEDVFTFYDDKDKKLNDPFGAYRACWVSLTAKGCVLLGLAKCILLTSRTL